MNIRSDMIRSQGGLSQPSQQMLSMNTPQFMQNQPLQQSANPMDILPNPNAPMAMLGGQPNSPMLMPNQQRYLQQSQLQQQRQMHLRPTQGGPNPGIPPPQNPHLNGLVPHQIQNMGFGGNMMQQPNNGPMRRVASQPPLNSGAGHLGSLGMPQVGAGGINVMNQQALRQQAHQQMRIQQQQQHQMQMQGNISPDMGLMNRQGNPGIQQNIGQRTSSAQMQLMNGLPNLTQSHPGAMQPSHHQNNFPNSIPPQRQISSSPRPGPQSHNPTNMGMGAPGPSHNPVNPGLNPEDGNPAMFMNFQNPQFPQFSGRLPLNSQFPFVPSSTSPNQHADIPQTMPMGVGGIGNPVPPTRPGFHLTPAQQFEQMQQSSASEGYNPNFVNNMPPPSLRPSHPHDPQAGPKHRPSPQPSDQQPIYPIKSIYSGPQRPGSRPQSQAGRPPSQPPLQTPRTKSTVLPRGPPADRIPQPQHGGGPQPQPPVPNEQQVVRTAPPSSAASSSGASSTTLTSDVPTGTVQVPRPVRDVVTLALGNGQGLIRLLQFSGILASENKEKLQLSFWNDLVKTYFTPKAVMKFTLWKDNQRLEAKPFEIGVPILPRFFLVTTQSGVKSMTLTMDGARERMYASGHSIVECVTAVWTYKYNNGYTVTLRGPLTAHVVVTSPHPPGSQAALAAGTAPYSLKFEDFQFDANWHDKYIALESVMGTRTIETPILRNIHTTPILYGTLTAQQQRDEEKKWEEPRILIERASIPGEPVNAFGIPQATMRCLELAESVGQMADLISFSNETKLGPLEALTKFAAKIRETQPLASTPSNNVQNSFIPFQTTNGVSSSPAVTLYSSTPAAQPSSSTNPQPPSTQTSPKNAPPSATSSPQKQHKTIPQPAASSSSASTSSAPPPAASGSGTPALANSSLKRKQTADTASPAAPNADQPPAKRATRKRGRTNAGG